ncbi:MAG: substrate-binding domain-containing protein, partial [Gemmatirosa sp.]
MRGAGRVAGEARRRSSARDRHAPRLAGRAVAGGAVGAHARGTRALRSRLRPRVHSVREHEVRRQRARRAPRRDGTLAVVVALGAEGGWREPLAVGRGRDAARAAAGELLALSVPPTAVFAASDHQALGVLEGATLAAVPVPERLSVVGFDDIELAR